MVSIIIKFSICGVLIVNNTNKNHNRKSISQSEVCVTIREIGMSSIIEVPTWDLEPEERKEPDDKEKGCTGVELLPEDDHDPVGERLPLGVQRFILGDQAMIPITKLEIGTILATNGNFSTVYTAKFKGQTVCVKAVTAGEEVRELVELSLLRHFNHPHVVSFLGASMRIGDNNVKEILCVMELMDCGDLKQMLKQGLQWKERITASLHAASALAYIHENQVIHRDIKTENFLVTRTPAFAVKLTDFGLSRGCSDVEEQGSRGSHRRRPKTFCGSDDYMAPEMILNLPYSPAIDVFGLGCTLIEICCNRAPGHKNFLFRTPQNNFQFDLEEFKQHCIPGTPESLYLLACECISYEPENRPSAHHCIEWLQDLATDFENNSCEIISKPVLEDTKQPLMKKGDEASVDIASHRASCCTIT